ncbi:hypothetical protein HDK64DRAFT_252452 [Phyllosticta capitalensis]
MHSAPYERLPDVEREMAPASLCSSTVPDLATLSHETFLSPLLPPKQHAFVKEQAVPFHRLELLETDPDETSLIDAIERKEPLKTRVLASVLSLRDAQFFSMQAMGQNMLIGAVKVAHAIERARRLLSKRDTPSRRRLRKRAATAKPEDSVPIAATFELASLAQESLEQSPPQPQSAADPQQDQEAAACCGRRSTLVELFAGKKPPRRDSVLDLGFELATLPATHDEHVHSPDCAVRASSQR